MSLYRLCAGAGLVGVASVLRLHSLKRDDCRLGRLMLGDIFDAVETAAAGNLLVGGLALTRLRGSPEFDRGVAELAGVAGVFQANAVTLFRPRASRMLSRVTLHAARETGVPLGEAYTRFEDLLASIMRAPCTRASIGEFLASLATVIEELLEDAAWDGSLLTHALEEKDLVGPLVQALRGEGKPGRPLERLAILTARDAGLLSAYGVLHEPVYTAITGLSLPKEPEGERRVLLPARPAYILVDLAVHHLARATHAWKTLGPRLGYL